MVGISKWMFPPSKIGNSDSISFKKREHGEHKNDSKMPSVP